MIRSTFDALLPTVAYHGVRHPEQVLVNVARQRPQDRKARGHGEAEDTPRPNLPVR
jgi:hypothetical protein